MYSSENISAANFLNAKDELITYTVVPDDASLLTTEFQPILWTEENISDYSTDLLKNISEPITEATNHTQTTLTIELFEDTSDIFSLNEDKISKITKMPDILYENLSGINSSTLEPVTDTLNFNEITTVSHIFISNTPNYEFVTTSYPEIVTTEANIMPDTVQYELNYTADYNNAEYNFVTSYPKRVTSELNNSNYEVNNMLDTTQYKLNHTTDFEILKNVLDYDNYDTYNSTFYRINLSEHTMKNEIIFTLCLLLLCLVLGTILIMYIHYRQKSKNIAYFSTENIKPCSLFVKPMQPAILLTECTSGGVQESEFTKSLSPVYLSVDSNLATAFCYDNRGFSNEVEHHNGVATLKNLVPECRESIPNLPFPIITSKSIEISSVGTFHSGPYRKRTPPPI